MVERWSRVLATSVALLVILITKGILCAPHLLPFNTAAAGSTTVDSIPDPQFARPAASSAASSPITSSTPQQEDDAVCLEKLGVQSYVDMAAHPDGSPRAFMSTKDGKIWLVSVPAHGSGDTMQIQQDGPFLDLTGRVLGLMGVAFHPEFASNGRFFVSYNCDTATSPACSPGNASSTSSPSQYQLVVAEFSANSNKGTRANPSEVRRIFSMGLPPRTSYSYHRHDGQILIQPGEDGGYLYLMTGGHGGEEDPFLGKILRFNVDSVNGQTRNGGTNSSATGNHSAAPSATMEEHQTLGMGLGDPRGCTFDSARPSYLFCASVDDQQSESVHLIIGPSTDAGSLIAAYGRPVSGTPSIIGGIVLHEGSADPSLNGRYLYMYGGSAWTAVEAPAGSGRYVPNPIPSIKCSGSSPAPCTGAGGIDGRVVSFGKDSSNDAFVLATGGIYRVVAPSLCRPPTSRSATASRGLPWLLSSGAFVLSSAFYICWKLLSKQRPQNCSCLSNNKCWCWCCSS